MKRLQVILDEMAIWEREVFEKEYSDMNWYKGKQAKHTKEVQSARQKQKNGTGTFLSHNFTDGDLYSVVDFTAGHFRTSQELCP